MTTRTLLLIISVLFVSCKNISSDLDGQDDIIITEFVNKGDTMYSKLVVSSDTTISLALNFTIVEDRAIVYNQRNDTVFDLYSLPDWKLISHTGVIGSGPTDFFHMEIGMFNKIIGGYQTFSIFRHELLNIEIACNTVNIASKKELPVEMMMSERCNMFSQNKYFYKVDNEIYEYFIYDINENAITSGSKYPLHWISEKMDGPKRHKSFMAFPVMKPDGSKFALFYRYFKRIRLFDNVTGEIQNLFVKIEPYNAEYKPSYDVPKSLYYTFPQTTDEAIYVLCHKCTPEFEYENTELQIWKWDGTPYATYPLDRPCKVLSLSEKYNKLYCIDIYDNIVEYEMP